MESLDVNAGTAHPKDQEGDHNTELVTALLAVCRNNFRGCYFLLREDHADQARALSRVLQHDVCRLLYFRKNKDRLTQMRLCFELASIRQETLLALELEKHVGKADDITEALQHLEKERDDLYEEAEKAGFAKEDFTQEADLLNKPERLLKALGQPEGYFVFRHASHAVHTTRLTLEWVKQHHDGKVTITFGASPESVLRVGIQVSEYFAFGLRSAVELLDWETQDAVVNFFDLTIENLHDLKQEAGLTGGISDRLEEQNAEAP